MIGEHFIRSLTSNLLISDIFMSLAVEHTYIYQQMSVPIKWPLNQSSWCTWVLHLIMTRTSCLCIIPTILNLSLHKHSLMSSYFLFVINLHTHILKLPLSRMMRLILISPHSMATMMTYHLLLHHLLIHLNHLVHACLNVPLVLSHPPESHARLLLSTTCLLEFLLYLQHLFATLGTNVPVEIPAIPPAPICHSEHKHHVPYQPGNIYGDNHHPVNQLKDIKRDEASTPSRSRIPRSFPDTAPSNISVPDMTAANLSEDEIEHITREGKVHWISTFYQRQSG